MCIRIWLIELILCHIYKAFSSVNKGNVESSKLLFRISRYKKTWGYVGCKFKENGKNAPFFPLKYHFMWGIRPGFYTVFFLSIGLFILFYFFLLRVYRYWSFLRTSLRYDLYVFIRRSVCFVLYSEQVISSRRALALG